MKFDLLIQGGTVIDGTGRPRYQADVGVSGDRIAAIGALGSLADEVVDARDQIVAPGFIDAHTHMDAQVFWDPLGTCSCLHGVTSVVMGNCGFTLAPARADGIDLVLENLEEAEAIPADVLAAGVEFRWSTFPEFLDVLEQLPKGINYSGYVGHSALRTFAMRERAFTEPATDEDMNEMAAALRDGLAAGAIGFSTSRNPGHIRPCGEPVASRVAGWEEVESLVGVMAEMGCGIFEISRGHPLPPEVSDEFSSRLRNLALTSHRPITLGVFSDSKEPGAWRSLLEVMEKTNAAGGRMVAQAHSNTMYQYQTISTHFPFDALTPWKTLSSLSGSDRAAALNNAELRRQLVESAEGMSQPPDYEQLMLVEQIAGPDRSVASRARESGHSPAEVVLEHLFSTDGDRFLRCAIANRMEGEIREVLEHPASVVTFSDSGAHVNQIADFSLQTHFLSHWVRELGAFTLEQAVQRITRDIAVAWGFADRGVLGVGKKADLAIFDPDTIGSKLPETANDLPLGAVRLRQEATGIQATVVNGQILIRDGEHTGNLPGELLKPNVAT